MNKHYIKYFLTLNDLSNIVDDILKFLLKLLMIHVFECIISGDELLNKKAVTYILILTFGSILYSLVANVLFKKNKVKPLYKSKKNLQNKK